MLAHRCDAIEFFPLVIITNETGIGFYWKCKSFFHRHIIDCDSSGEGSRSYSPILAHGFDVSEDITFVVATWFVMKRFTHDRSPFFEKRVEKSAIDAT